MAIRKILFLHQTNKQKSRNRPLNPEKELMIAREEGAGGRSQTGEGAWEAPASGHGDGRCSSIGNKVKVMVLALYGDSCYPPSGEHR